MWQDHIVAEVRKIRDRHAASFNYDLDAIFQDLKKQEKKSRRKFIALPSKQALPFGRMKNRAARNNAL
jgi:hypothetical protein